MDSHQSKMPSVFDYLEVLFYLQDYYKFRKTNDKKFSYESWSLELNFKSRSFLRMMITGKKKISPKLVETFSKLNFATKGEEDYFHCMVKHSYAASAKDKQMYSQSMIQILKYRNQIEVIEDSSDFGSSPLFARLKTLLSFKDFERTTSEIARVMGVDLQTILLALSKLEQLDLVKKIVIDGKEQWTTEIESFKVPDNKGSINLKEFHEKSLMDAIKAFSQPKELRSYRSLFLPMTDEGLQEFHKLLEDFANEQLVRYNTPDSKGKRVFQANFNIHAVSEVLETKTSV